MAEFQPAVEAHLRSKSTAEDRILKGVVSPNFKNILVEPIETFGFEDEDSLVVRALACVERVSVWFRSKQGGTRISKDRAKNSVSFFGSRFISRAVKTENALPRSFLRNQTETLATQTLHAREPAPFWRENVVAVVVLLRVLA